MTVADLQRRLALLGIPSLSVEVVDGTYSARALGCVSVIAAGAVEAGTELEVAVDLLLHNLAALARRRTPPEGTEVL